MPFAFTEHGAIMAATVLNNPRAVAMTVHVVRAFVKLREMLSSNRELARRFAQLETRLDKKLTEHDQQIATIIYDSQIHARYSSNDPLSPCCLLCSHCVALYPALTSRVSA